MKRGPTGVIVRGPPLGGEVVRAFVPAALPPAPELVIDAVLREQIDQALIEVGRLDAVSSLLPDPALFLFMYLRKEAVLSSQIEGTQSSLADLLLFDAGDPERPTTGDAREVSSHVRALEQGVQRIRGGFPLSSRLLREVHAILLEAGRGREKQPGEFRTSQNWIGGARPGVATYVPPPPDAVVECMAALEKFLHDEPVRTPVLIKAALAHVQFESIHPFLDGNGRLGRLLIPLLLVTEGVLREPLLYLSLWFKTHRDRYYELLQLVRTEGDWESWIAFFMEGVRETARQATSTAKRLSEQLKEDRDRIAKLDSAPGSALRLHQALTSHPILTVGKAVELTGLTPPTVGTALRSLEQLGLVRETTGQRRNRRFRYDPFLTLLEEGTTSPFPPG